MKIPVKAAGIGVVAIESPFGAYPQRASAVGVYRLWRDLGYAVGAVLAGVVADLAGLSASLWLIAALTFLSGVVVAVRMRGAPPSGV